MLPAGREESRLHAEAFFLGIVVLAHEVAELGPVTAAGIRLAEHGGDHSDPGRQDLLLEARVGDADDAGLPYSSSCLRWPLTDRAFVERAERVMAVVVADGVGDRMYAIHPVSRSGMSHDRCWSTP